MEQPLIEIAKKLKNEDKKVQLIYAFNGSGKTRLSLEFSKLFSNTSSDSGESLFDREVLYYNAFTEDLFYWNHADENEIEPKLKVFSSNKLIRWILEYVEEKDIQETFQYYSNSKLACNLNKQDGILKDIYFSYQTGDDQSGEKIKISKGEESNFIWVMFYELIKFIVNSTDEQISTKIKYIFIDDPVSSLDENHLIQLAIDLAQLINKSNGINFIITTHNVLFYNILYNELGLNKKGSKTYILKKNKSALFKLEEKKGDSNKSFSYHLYLKEILEKVNDNDIEKYHFMLLRNLYEKVANFLGYPNWSTLLPEDSRNAYYNRIINFSSHLTLANETIGEPTLQEKRIVKYLLKHLVQNYNFYREDGK